MRKYADRVREKSTSTGTGNFLLLGAITHYRTFLSAIGKNKTFDYVIENKVSGEWEIGYGTLTTSGSSTYLVRSTIISSSNHDNAVSFGTGDKIVSHILSHSTVDQAFANGVIGPQGDQGVQGVQGPQGPQGATGATGSTGPQGTQGPQGAQGAQGATGTADVTGPGSSTDTAVPTFSGTGGKTLQNSAVTISSAGKVKAQTIYGDLGTATDGATVTFNMDSYQSHIVTLGGNRTLAVSNVSTGQRFTIFLKQDATGSRTVTWFSGISWPSGTTPTLTTTASKTDVFVFYCYGSSTYYGFTVAQNM